MVMREIGAGSHAHDCAHPSRVPRIVGAAMAEDLESYFRTDYKADSAAMDEVQRLIDEVLGTFAQKKFFHESPGTWPYELVNGVSPRVPSQLSFSTTAMISFALALANGRLRGSSLAPAVGHPQGADALRSRVDEIIDHALDCIIAHNGQMPAILQRRLREGYQKPTHKANPLTDSATFGWDDPFTLSWLLETLNGTKNATRKKFLRRVQKRAWDLVERVASHPEGDVLDIKRGESVPHAFTLLRVLQIARTLSRMAGHADVNDYVDVATLRDYLINRVHLRLSESQIPDSGFDAADLVFSIEGWILASPTEPDLAVVDQAFEVLTERQERTPYWRPLRPFKVTQQGLILLPQSVETANSLLRICSSPALEAREYFTKHYRLLDRYRQWLQGRVYRGRIDGAQFTGWESEHTHTGKGIHLWQTSQVLIFLQHYMAMRQQFIAQKLLRLAPLVPDPRPPARPRRPEDPVKEWRKTRKREPVTRPLAATGSRYFVYEQIEKDFIKPWADGNTEEQSVSMLLYGPPGTGKSTIARKVAEALGFPLLTVTPSDFLTAGGEAVEARAKAIFDVLGEQRDMVVLFDEIDHLLLDRDSGFYRLQGDVFKLLTPGMLTKLNVLAKQHRVIFIIATNYYERIDRALKRPGRIDARYLVLPPDLRQRRARLEQVVAGWKTLEPQEAEPIATATALFTYRELDELAAHVKKRLEGPSPPPPLATALEESVREAPPMISLETYSSRLGMKWNDGALVETAVDTVEQPWEEISMLANLKRETQGWPAHPEWLPDAVKEALRRKVIADRKVVGDLSKALKHVRGDNFLDDLPGLLQ